MERAVKRSLERRNREVIVHLGVDEKAFRKGHRYLTLVNDLGRSRVLVVCFVLRLPLGRAKHKGV